MKNRRVPCSCFKPSLCRQQGRTQSTFKFLKIKDKLAFWVPELQFRVIGINAGQRPACRVKIYGTTHHPRVSQAGHEVAHLRTITDRNERHARVF